MKQRGGEHQHDEATHRTEQRHILLGHQLDQQREDAQRCQAHDPADDAHHQLEKFLQHHEYIAVAVAAGHQGDADEHGEHHDGQDAAVGQCGEGVLEQVGEEVQEELRQRQLTRLEVVHRLGEQIQRQPRARLEDVRRDQRHQHRRTGGEGEVDQGAAPHPVHLMVRLQIGHADHDGGEDQRDQHHLQQADEDAPGQGACIEHALAYGRFGRQCAGQPADGDTQAGRDKNLQVETGQRGGSSDR